MALMKSPERVAAPSVTATLLPILAVVFASYLVIGITMPVLLCAAVVAERSTSTARSFR